MALLDKTISQEGRERGLAFHLLAQRRKYYPSSDRNFVTQPATLLARTTPACAGVKSLVAPHYPQARQEAAEVWQKKLRR